MELFRKVKCTERKPKESGNYLTNKGYVEYDSVTKNFFDDEDGETIEGIYHWFEPVEIPTDEEIEKIIESTYPATCKDKELFDHFAFYFGGFKAAIDHLIGGK